MWNDGRSAQITGAGRRLSTKTHQSSKGGRGFDSSRIRAVCCLLFSDRFRIVVREASFASEGASGD